MAPIPGRRGCDHGRLSDQYRSPENNSAKVYLTNVMNLKIVLLKMEIWAPNTAFVCQKLSYQWFSIKTPFLVPISDCLLWAVFRK
jgi:hypothetical protein